MIIVKPPSGSLALRTQSPVAVVTRQPVFVPLEPMYSDFVAELLVEYARGPPAHSATQVLPTNGQCYYNADRFLRLDYGEA